MLVTAIITAPDIWLGNCFGTGQEPPERHSRTARSSIYQLSSSRQTGNQVLAGGFWDRGVCHN
jgi:hypothetical protein